MADETLRSSGSADPMDAIPMKGVSPVWYAVGGITLLVVGGLTTMLGMRGSTPQDKPLQVAPASAGPSSADLKQQAAEQRRHMEITQRALEQLEEAQTEQKAATPTAAAAAPAPTAAPAAPAVVHPAAPPRTGAASEPAAGAERAPAPPPKAPAKQLDALDSIGSDITKELSR